jgi:hypothetical protein
LEVKSRYVQNILLGDHIRATPFLRWLAMWQMPMDLALGASENTLGDGIFMTSPSSI